PVQSGLPPAFSVSRGAEERRDTRPNFDGFTYPNNIVRPTLTDMFNSGVILVLVDPNGGRHYFPREIEPDAAGQGGLQGTTYPKDATHPLTMFHPAGGNIWTFDGGGVFYRFRMVSDQYIFNYGSPISPRGEGPYNAFGGPTIPDGLPA